MTETAGTPSEMQDDGVAARNAYYAAAGSWADDRNDGLRRSRRTAWIVAGTVGVIAVFEALALMLLMPLKTVVPYTLMVDRQTGYVEALDPLEPARVSGDKALTQSFLVQYVIGRESYDFATVRTDYARIALWSGEGARSDYLAAMQGSNPDSPIVRDGRATVVTTRVKSVSPVGPSTAMVRFDTGQRSQGGQVRSLGSWVAVVRYRFVGTPMRVEDRYINPLGFQVTSYRKDAEALPPAADVEPAVNRMTTTAISDDDAVLPTSRVTGGGIAAR